MSKPRYYVAGDGIKYPLIEATLPFGFHVYRTDCAHAVIGDPFNCLIARGGRRHRNVHAVYIGSGKDAYVIMKIRGKLIAVHYTINAKAAAIRDAFDQNKKLATQEIELSVPTSGRTLAHRSVLGKKRRAAIKNGATVSKRAKPNETRVMRIGVPHRPRAKIDHGNVTLVPKKEDEIA